MTLLRSINFCNKYIYTHPRKDPIFYSDEFLFCLGILLYIYCFFIHKYVKEKSFDKSSSFDEIKNAYSSLKGFWINKDLRNLLFYFILSVFTFGPI